MDEIEKAWQDYLHRILIPPEENIKWLRRGFVDGYKYAQQSVQSDKCPYCQYGLIVLPDKSIIDCIACGSTGIRR